MILVDNSEESKSLLKYFEEQTYRTDNKDDIDNIREICILTAYCYYKVFFHIIENEKARSVFMNAKVKIIIGMRMYEELTKLYLAYNEDDKIENRTEIIEEIINNFKKYTKSEAQKEEYFEIIKLFEEKCKNGTLEIRKSEEDTHSKLYLFKYDLSSL